MAPIYSDVLNRSIRKTAWQQSKRLGRRVVLFGVGVAAGKVIIRARVVVDLYVVLVGIECLNLGVSRIILKTRASRGQVQR